MVTPILSTTLEERVKSVRAQGLLARADEHRGGGAQALPRGAREGSASTARWRRCAPTPRCTPRATNAFAIVVRGKDASLAARAANRLAELYIEGNLQVRAGQVTRVREIVSHKLAEMRGELAKAEAKVSAFKDAHKSELPELMEARLHERLSLSRQIEMETGFVQEAQRRLDLQGTQPFGKGHRGGAARGRV